MRTPVERISRESRAGYKKAVFCQRSAGVVIRRKSRPTITGGHKKVTGGGRLIVD